MAGLLKSQPSRKQAKRIITALRNGVTPTDGARFYSVGRDKIFKVADHFFGELEETSGGQVRWVKAAYSSGKTNTFIRLAEGALDRNWLVSFVVISGRGEGLELQKFDQFYRAIIDGCTSTKDYERDQDGFAPGRVDGWRRLLDDWCSKIHRTHSDGLGTRSMAQKNQVLEATRRLTREAGIHTSFAAALREYALAKLASDDDNADLLMEWFRGTNVHSRGGETRRWLREKGIMSPIRRDNAKEMLRSVSAFVRHLDFGGLLVLVDEIERTLVLPDGQRRLAYTILREMVDNVDDRHGMIQTAFYFSGTPEFFDGKDGISQYDALASRVRPPPRLGPPNPASSVVALDDYPLTESDCVEVAIRLSELHALSNRKDSGLTAENAAVWYQDWTQQSPYGLVREWVRAVVDRLDAELWTE